MLHEDQQQQQQQQQQQHLHMNTTATATRTIKYESKQLQKFNLYNWKPNVNLSDDVNYMDLVLLITRNSQLKQCSMGCIIVAAAEAEAEAKAQTEFGEYNANDNERCGTKEDNQSETS